jgi:hypothetical protein
LLALGYKIGIPTHENPIHIDATNGIKTNTGLGDIESDSLIINNIGTEIKGVKHDKFD